MLSIALTLALLQPLSPVTVGADTNLELDDALTIPMGEYLPAIKAERLVMDHEILITLDVNSWLRLKDVVLGQGDICQAAVTATAVTCQEQSEKLLTKAKAEASKQKASDAELIGALKRELSESKLLASSNAKSRDHYKWALVSVSAVTVVVSSIMIVQMYD
jgi:hypothetical protein